MDRKTKAGASPFLTALVRAHLLAPEGSPDEESLRRMLEARAERERRSLDRLQREESERLRAEGLL